MVRAIFTRQPVQPRTRSPQPFRWARPTVEQLETRDVPATAIPPGRSLSQQLVAMTPPGQVSVQAIPAPPVVNQSTVPNAFAAAALLDVISAMQSSAAMDLSFIARMTEVRVLALVRSH